MYLAPMEELYANLGLVQHESDPLAGGELGGSDIGHLTQHLLQVNKQ